MKLVERADAIATLDGLLASAVAGKGRIAVIAGAVASGKTELLNTYADRAVDRDALAITAIGADASVTCRSVCSPSCCSTRHWFPRSSGAR